MDTNLRWIGCFSEDVMVMTLDYNGWEFRILITPHYNSEPDFYPQCIDERFGAIDFALDKAAYTYDECIELIKNFNPNEM